MENVDSILSQDDLNDLLHINDFIDEYADNSLIVEIKSAILDSGKLEIGQWKRYVAI